MEKQAAERMIKVKSKMKFNGVYDWENVYIYQNHIGGYYYALADVEEDDLYCENCNDSDLFVETLTYKEYLKKYVEKED